MARMEDIVFAIVSFFIVGFFLALAVTEIVDDNVTLTRFEDGSAIVCDGDKVVVVKDAEGETWYTPEGIALKVCKY